VNRLLTSNIVERGSAWSVEWCHEKRHSDGSVVYQFTCSASIAQDERSVGPRSSQIPQHEKGNTTRAIDYEIAGLRPAGTGHYMIHGRRPVTKRCAASGSCWTTQNLSSTQQALPPPASPVSVVQDAPRP
jgi:hypothetical protein